MKKKNFIFKNEEFLCKFCNHKNKPLSPGKIRNHCSECLNSLHVDSNIPGDRLSECFGQMAPVKASYSKKKGWSVIHDCVICGKQIPNRLSEDDNWELFTRLTKFTNDSNLK